MTSYKNILKIQRPNSLKIAILVLLFYSESYAYDPHIDRTLTKGRLYEILKVHYKISNSRAIKNQLDLLKAESLIIEQGNYLRLNINDDMLLKVYRILMEAPDDIFPVYQREIDFFHYVVKNPDQNPKETWENVLVNRRHPDNEQDEFTYSKEGLFRFMISGFQVVDLWIKPDILPFCALRYLAKVIFEDMRTCPGCYIWPYPEIEHLKEGIAKSIGSETDYEQVFDMLKEKMDSQLIEKITKTVFPYHSDIERIEYIIALGSSPSALYFFFDIGNADSNSTLKLVAVNISDKAIYSQTSAWLKSFVLRDLINNDLQITFRFEGYTINSEELRTETKRYPAVF